MRDSVAPVAHTGDVLDEARLALGLIGQLTDAEQYLLQRWLLHGTRWPLALAGVDPADFPEPLFEGDDPSSAEEPPYPRRPPVLYAVLWFVFVRPVEIMPLIREWFFWRGRAPLYEAGFTDEEIGPWRVIPDDIFAQDDAYGAAADGTFEYCTTEEGYSAGRLKLGDRVLVT